ncbi:MAG: beta-propeller fold lactonase family protein [Oscillospiraceae bacterium]|nr:beta-propeller fold lactonase family protein [Oscillospiraceae bacterium]
MKYWISGTGGENGGCPLPSICLYDTEAARPSLWESTLSGPTWLDLWEDKLLAVGEQEDSGCVYLFRREGDCCTLLDTRPIDGTSFCHLTVFPRHRVVAGACYGTGHVFTLKITETGFGGMKSWIRQSDEPLTRAHCIICDSAETTAYTANIALDRLYSYDIAEDGALTNERYLQLPKGEGIRHLLLREDTGMLYATTEYSNRILIIDVSGSEPVFLGGVDALEPDFAMPSYLSGLCMNSAGTLLYAANRGADTFSVFRVEGKELQKVAERPCFGKFPRSLALVENETAIAAANQNSNSVIFVGLDQDGIPTEPIRVIPFLKPMFIRQTD